MKPELSKFNIDEIRRSVAIVTEDCKLTPVQRSKFRLINSALAELMETIGELKRNCMNCDHPWRKGANEVYCYAKDDEYYEHALVISDPKHHTCFNHKPQGKRKPYCGYKWGCGLNIDGKCTHSETCHCQVVANGRTREEEAQLVQTEKDEENERLEYERLKEKYEGKKKDEQTAVYECAHFELDQDDPSGCGGSWSWCHNEKSGTNECDCKYIYAQQFCPFYKRGKLRGKWLIGDGEIEAAKMFQKKWDK